MGKTYIMFRMPKDIYDRCKEIQAKMKDDLRRINGKEPKLPMTHVLKAIVDPKLNQNYIRVDLNKLSRLSRRKRNDGF